MEVLTFFCISLDILTLYVFLNKLISKFCLYISDPVNGEEWKVLDDSLAYACDLVHLIKLHFQDYFTICVAGIIKLYCYLKWLLLYPYSFFALRS